MDVAAHDRPVQGASQPRPAAFHEAARLPQDQDRARRGHVLHRPERPQDPRFLRRLRLARLRPQPSAHPRGAARSSRTRSARRSPSPSCRNMRRRWRTTSPRSRPAISTWCSSARPARRRWKRRSRSPSAPPGPKRPKIVYAENSFHGKTKGVLVDHRRPALPRRVQAGRQHGARAVRRHRGDRARASRPIPTIGIIVLETIQGGGGIIQAPAGLLAEAARALRQAWRALGRRRGAVRLGRTGHFYRLRALRRGAGCDGARQVARRRQGGGRRDDRPARGLHEGLWHAEDRDDPRQATFGGMGEACVTAIEALNVLYDEDLIDNAAAPGDYLLERLNGAAGQVSEDHQGGPRRGPDGRRSSSRTSARPCRWCCGRWSRCSTTS